MSNEAIFADFPPYKAKKGEEYMNLKQLEHFSLILMTWKRKLLEEANHMVDELSQDTKYLADENDRASREEQFAIKLRTRDRERKLVRKIDEALTRIHSNCFGYCEECGAEIGLPRLEARPTAELCIDCKSIQETRERQGTLDSS